MEGEELAELLNSLSIRFVELVNNTYGSSILLIASIVGLLVGYYIWVALDKNAEVNRRERTADIEEPKEIEMQIEEEVIKDDAIYNELDQMLEDAKLRRLKDPEIANTQNKIEVNVKERSGFTGFLFMVFLLLAIFSMLGD
jgi:hypothetical protein